MRHRSRQTGGAVLAVVVSLLVVAAATLAIRMASQIADKTEQHQLTQERLQRIQVALHAHVASHGRLPCPANGSVDTGQADPVGAAPVCTSPDGTVPWMSLGLSAEEARDAWGRKISYRVYDGASGLTQAGGADMTACDTVEPAPVAPVAPGFLCTAAHDVLPGPGGGTFLDPVLRSGLTVRVAGTLQTQMAWVLASHGASGMGAWLPGSSRMGVPTSADELANTQPPPAISVQREENTVDLDPATAATHFDDLLRFESISQLIHAAGRGARDWPETVPPPPASGINLTSGLLESAGVHFSGRDSNTSMITVDGGSVGTVTIASSVGDISRNSVPSGTGIGACTIGCGNDSNSSLNAPESLSFKLNTSTAEKFALGLLGLNSTPTTVAVSLTFKRSGAVVGGPVTYSAMVTDGPLAGPQLTNLMPAPPAVFDEVVVQPVGSSQFFVAHIRFCTAAENCN